MTIFTPLSTSYSDAGEIPNDMQNGGHRTFLLPMLRDTITALAASYASLGLSSSPIAMAAMPTGRLTLTAGTPVLNASTTGSTTVYYTPYTGNYVPIYNGSVWASKAFTELSIALDSNAAHTGYHNFGAVYDFFVFNDSGTLRVGTGPAWTSLTSRGTGAGTTELQRVTGILTNKNSMTARFGNVSGNTVTVAANCGTYVGSMYATAGGQTGMSFTPVAAAGGSAPVLGLFNQYNRVPVGVQSLDSTTSWTYASGTVRAANNSASNRFYWLDGTQESELHADYTVLAAAGTGPVSANAGLSVDATNSLTTGTIYASSLSTVGSMVTAVGVIKPLLGFHFISAVEFMASATTGTFFAGSGTMMLRGRISM